MGGGADEGDPPQRGKDTEKWRALDRTMTEARGKLADLPPEALRAVLDEAVAAARKPR